MRFCSALQAAAWVALLAAILAIGATGCARSTRERPAAPEPARSAAAAPVPSAPAPEERDPERDREARGAPGRLDPSEEITAEELATISDPVPGAPSGGEERPPSGAPSGAPSGSAPGLDPSSGDFRAPETPSGAVEGAWCVQVFATESREEAERVARAASSRLGAEAQVDRDGALYKVRLGRFTTEAEAQALRERAVRGGYLGAFRTRARP